MEPDFGRDVRAVLGLPFDALSEAQAEQALREAAATRRRCFLSTPNLNFAIQCQADAEFRDSVLQSNLSVADGWPIVWVARLLGATLPERVAGSSLFERLHRRAGDPLRVYLFGGPPGAAAAACARVNATEQGLVCVGHDEPGFGSVEEMSAEPRLLKINDSGADFLVVALGARKGQAWIQRNLHRLNAPIVSHLGAVVNFAAGTLQRAPLWAQRCKLEWLWRVKEEPSLWRRYGNDGFAFLRLLLTRVLPLAWWLRVHAPTARQRERAQVSVQIESDHAVLQLQGAWTLHNIDALRQALRSVAAQRRSVVFDLSALSYADSAVLGLLMLMHGWQRRCGLGWKLLAASARARRVLRGACAEYLLTEHPREPAGAAAISVT